MANGAIKILVVDDDPALAAVLETCLRQQNDYEVRSCLNAAEALELIEAQDFDLVVTDYALNHARYNGLDILRRSRRRAHTLVIMITAFASLEIILESIHLGAHDFLTKPFQLDELQLVVRNAAERIRLERENEALRGQVAQLIATLDEIEAHYGRLLEKVGQWERELEGSPLPVPARRGPLLPEPQLESLRRQHMQEQITAYVRMGETLRERLAREREKIEALFKNGLLPAGAYRRALREGDAKRST